MGEPVYLCVAWLPNQLIIIVSACVVLGCFVVVCLCLGIFLPCCFLFLFVVILNCCVTIFTLLLRTSHLPWQNRLESSPRPAFFTMSNAAKRAKRPTPAQKAHNAVDRFRSLQQIEAAIEEAELAGGEHPWDLARMRNLQAMTELAQALLKMLIGIRLPRSLEGFGDWIGRARTLVAAVRGK